MNQVITATIEDGVLKPDQEIAFATGAKLRVTIEPCDEEIGHVNRACDELDALYEEFPVESREPRLNRDQLHERH